MKIEKFVTGILSTNTYLVINETTGQTVLIDPAAAPSYLMSHLEKKGLTVEAVLLTHGHFDHMMGLEVLLPRYDVPVYVHEADAPLMTDTKLNLSSIYTGGCTFDRAIYIKDGQRLSLAGMEFLVIHTPGHTPGGVCYYMEAEAVLFSGDTLFQDSVGRTDFPLSSTEELFLGIREKLLVLPENVKVYPGHAGETTIGHEQGNF